MSVQPHDPRTTAGRDPRAAVDELLARLDPLAHPARSRALAAWARERAGSGGLGTLLAELETRGTYGRRLAAVAACAGQDAGHLADRLADPDPAVRGHALRASRHLPISDDALERAMEDAPGVVRAAVEAAVVAGGRTALAERLIGPVRERWGEAEAVRLLPGCGTETVRALLPGLFPAVTHWRVLARRHPDAVLDEAARQLAGLPEAARADWWLRNGDIFPAAAEALPTRVLDVLEEHCPPHLPFAVRACLAPLLRAAPGRTIGLLTAPERAARPAPGLVSRTALGRIARRGVPELTDLGREWSRNPEAYALLLRALPPPEREAFHDTVTAGRDLSRTALADCVLEALPRRRAQAEARRMAEQAAERGESWLTVLAAVAHLPVGEARERLLAATRRPAAESRAAAYPLLVRNAARSGDPAAVAVLLGDLQRLRNEQEPVRGPALLALAEVPPRLFSGADKPRLDTITADAVEARDSSGRTWHALSALAVRMLREHAVSGERDLLAWALETVTRLSGHTGGHALGHLDAGLRKGQEFQVFEALRPWLEAGADKADHSLTFALARALGRRAHRMPELQELLWEAVRSGNDTTVRHAVDLLLDDPARRDGRTERILELEPSAAVLPPVLQVLTRRRTDLLDAVLTDTPPYGRFLTPGTPWLPPVDGIHTWLPRQQAAAARLLARAAADAGLPQSIRAAHIRALAAVPEHGFKAVRRWTGSPATVLAEAALAALAWTDRPADALPLLLEHAGDDRARVAVHAAHRVCERIAPSALEAVLRAALLPGAGGAPAAAKVTSRKEFVRLAAAGLPVSTAAGIVAGTFDLPDQHPDVRAACVAVAAGLLPAPAAWGLLEAAADGPPVTRTALLRVRPYELRALERPRFARLVGRVTHTPDRETADLAAGLLAVWAPWYPEAGPLLAARTTDLGNRTAWHAAADGLVALAAAPDGDGPLLDALARLAAVPADHLDAEAERDLPARRRLAHLVTRLASAAAPRPAAAHRAAAGRAAELLCAAPGFLPQGAQLAATALDLDATAPQLLGGLDDLAGLHADRPLLADRTASTLRSRLTAAHHPGDPLVLLAAAERLTLAGTHAAGLLALAVTQALGSRTSWPQEWRARLRALRRHACPDVRDAALAVTTAAE
ncbi:hypothetical protein [Streptomyces sp. NRRL F-5123]|uniref:hypothetical protein n=1 Tax=Streptomyces sp. NRRL F-5123 TaxID=1463856 RepID=UPI0006941BEC|nr:hypothetical protein [Streptomyces sp. NRRL F-5123]